MLAKGWPVHGVVRTSTRLDNLPAGVRPTSLNTIGPEADWSEVLIDVDTVVHLAARVHRPKENSLDSLASYRRVNVAGTKRLAQMAADCNVRRLIYISSIKVNGEGRAQPYTEEDTPEPADPYGVSKWEAEQILYEIADATGLEVVVLRPPLVYGPGVKANFLRLMEIVARGIPLPLANVNNRRSLIFLENLVDAIATCVSHPDAAGQIYLVSDREDISTPELIRRVAAALGCPARLFSFSPPLMQLAGRISGKSAALERLLGSLTVDISKIQRELDWKIPYTMGQGLMKTAEWYLKGRKKVSG